MHNLKMPRASGLREGCRGSPCLHPGGFLVSRGVRLSVPLLKRPETCSSCLKSSCSHKSDFWHPLPPHSPSQAR